jgi:hypothetical protein
MRKTLKAAYVLEDICDLDQYMGVPRHSLHPAIE